MEVFRYIRRKCDSSSNDTSFDMEYKFFSGIIIPSGMPA